MADFYNTLTTNPSHNPLNEILLRWLTMRFPALEWRGWPNQRGTGPSVSDDGGRRQWTFVSRTDALVICAEAKSVTANNWGNKSKEIFDRVAELRTACASAGIECLTLLMFDGDLSQDNLRELSSGIAHDEIWGVDEVPAKLEKASPGECRGGCRDSRPAASTVVVPTPPDAQQQQAVDAPASRGSVHRRGPGHGKDGEPHAAHPEAVRSIGVPPEDSRYNLHQEGRGGAAVAHSRVGIPDHRLPEERSALSPRQKAFVDAVDINQVRTGTVDSLCEQLLREFRAPGTQPPVLVDEFVSKTLMLREGLFGSRRDQNPALDASS